jgi:hypothetical protein
MTSRAASAGRLDSLPREDSVRPKREEHCEGRVGVERGAARGAGMTGRQRARAGWCGG